MMALSFEISILVFEVIWFEVFLKAMIANIRVSMIQLPIIPWEFAISFFVVLAFLKKWVYAHFPYLNFSF